MSQISRPLSLRDLRSMHCSEGTAQTPELCCLRFSRRDAAGQARLTGESDWQKAMPAEPNRIRCVGLSSCPSVTFPSIWIVPSESSNCPLIQRPGQEAAGFGVCDSRVPQSKSPCREVMSLESLCSADCGLAEVSAGRDEWGFSTALSSQSAYLPVLQNLSANRHVTCKGA